MVNDDIIRDIEDELILVRNNFSNFKNYHEGYAFILEKVDNLWNKIKKSEHSNTDYDRRIIKKEAIQLASMAIRFIEDLCE